jgi:hypothetical protein
VDIRRSNLLSIILSQEIPAHPACNRPVANVTTLRKLGFVVTKMAGRNPDWTRDELILALDLYVRFKSAPERRARKAADFALRLIQDRYERELKKGIHQLNEPEVKARITAEVTAAMTPMQGSLELGAPVVDVAKVVEIVTAKVTELTIEIPEIVVLPTREVTFGYHDFDLQGLESIARQPVSDQIMVQRLRDDARTYLARAVEGAREDRPENYLVRHLMDMPEVDYDSQNESAASSFALCLSCLGLHR